MNNDKIVCLDMLMTGKLIKNHVLKSGYSVKDLQKKLNLSCPQPVYRWLNGQTMPSLDNLYMLCGILNVHMEDLLMPRMDEIWIVHDNRNCDIRKRMMTYFKRIAV